MELPELEKQWFGITKKEALADGLCIECKRVAALHCHTDAGRREYKISGLCEECFDSITQQDYVETLEDE